jgi:hypothetical protein
LHRETFFAAIKNPRRRASRVLWNSVDFDFARETHPASTVMSIRAEGRFVLLVVVYFRLTRYRRVAACGET